MFSNKIKKVLKLSLLGLISTIPLITAACSNGIDGFYDNKVVNENTTLNNQKVYEFFTSGFPINLTDTLFTREKNNIIVPKEDEDHFTISVEPSNSNQKTSVEWKNFEQSRVHFEQKYKNKIYTLLNSAADVDKLQSETWSKNQEQEITTLKNQLKNVDFNNKSILVINGLYGSLSSGGTARFKGFKLNNLVVENNKIMLEFKPRIKESSDGVVQQAVGERTTKYFVIIDKINSLDNYQISWKINPSY